MIDWMLDFVLNFCVVVMFLLCLALVGVGLMAVTAVVYHVFDPSCPTVICT